MQSRISVVMSSSLMDGGSNNVLVIFTGFARLASFHAAPAGAANPHRSWDLVAQMVQECLARFVRTRFSR